MAETRIIVLRAANKLSDDVDMSEVKTQSYEYVSLDIEHYESQLFMSTEGNVCPASEYFNLVWAFDMMQPFKKVSKKAIAEFQKQYLYAIKNYFAPQKD